MSSKLKKPEKGLVVLMLVARSLAVYLLGEEKRAVFVRIADRFSVNPATTYLDKEFRALLDAPDSLLEYKQVNLANKANHEDVFAPPSEWAGKPTDWVGFDVVYDLTGETGFDKPELMQISNTYQLAISLATSASHLSAAQLPKAYVRLTFPFYEMKSLSSSSPGHEESSDLRPDGIRGRWWHETLRGLAKITNLNTGVIRCGAWYGRGTWEGEVVTRLVVGQVYKHLKEEMKFLYNSDLRIHTVHSIDIAQSLYLLSLYLMDTPRETVLKQAAVDIPFSFSLPLSSTFSLGSNKRSSLGESWKTVKTVVQDKEKVRIPLFNVVDEGDTTQDKLARAVAEVWDIKYGFLNSTMASLVQSFAKTDFNDMIDDVNEMHVEAWSDMLSASDPPILSTPISPFLGEHAFRKHAICFDGSKAKQILGFQPIMPKIQIDELRAIVKGFQNDQLWPR